MVRGKDYHLIEQPAIQKLLQRPPDQSTLHPESGASRALYECGPIQLTPTGPVLRMLLATHPAGSSRPPVGKVREGTVYEQFFTTLPHPSFTPADVLDLYRHRGSFEAVLADEDEEQAADRWVSRTQWGQEFWQIINQWVWNLRLRTQTVLLTVHATATIVRTQQRSSSPSPPLATRAERAHWRLSWEQRLARNARPSTAPFLEITLHGLSAPFIQSFALPVRQVS